MPTIPTLFGLNTSAWLVKAAQELNLKLTDAGKAELHQNAETSEHTSRKRIPRCGRDVKDTVTYRHQ
jgi:hypothetical protein